MNIEGLFLLLRTPARGGKLTVIEDAAVKLNNTCLKKHLALLGK